MNRRRPLARIAIAGLAAIAGSLLVAPAANATETVDPLSAIASTAPDSLSDLGDVDPSPQDGIALEASLGGVEVSVPRDAEDDVSVSGGSWNVEVGLPFAEEASEGKVETEGVVSFDNRNGSSSVPIVKDDGALQINTVISRRSAPTRYEYPLSIPSDASLVPIGDAVAIVSSSLGAIATIDAPWATDAAGRAVPTHYEIEGTTLVQVIDHHSGQISYPIVADPKFVWEGILPAVKTTRAETKDLAAIGATALGPSKACSKFVTAAGIVGAALCAANSASIMVNATRIYYAGKCAELLIGPGVIATVEYKDSYCK